MVWLDLEVTWLDWLAITTLYDLISPKSHSQEAKSGQAALTGNPEQVRGHLDGLSRGRSGHDVSHPELGQVTSGPDSQGMSGHNVGYLELGQVTLGQSLYMTSSQTAFRWLKSSQVGSGQVGLGNSRHFNHHDNVDKTIYYIATNIIT